MLAVAIAIVKRATSRSDVKIDNECATRLYARGFLFCAIVVPLFSTGVALSIGRAWRFCRSAATAPAIRICSTVSEAEADLVPSGSWTVVFSSSATSVLLGGNGVAFGTLGKRSGTICTIAPSESWL